MPTRPTRSQVIGTLVTEAVLQTRTTWDSYADAVVRHYHDATDLGEREVTFHIATTAGNAVEATRKNTQTVRRLLIGEIRMHVDIEEALVAALPQDWRQRLHAALLARSGLIYAEAPRPVDAPSHFNAPCQLMRTTAEAIERIEPMLTDGRIGPDDLPYFDAAQRGLDMVTGVCLTVRAQIEAARKAHADQVARRGLN
ncbi:hypothetical protein [Pseudoxanthomonas sp. USHLN014]|uniref:hypothetical protein n=1 Tax=Pseudoxanthomonas sp. USHLN014 TaxID=3081297 RepID=UPI00301E4FED